MTDKETNVTMDLLPEGASYIDEENPNKKWVRQGDFMVLVDVSED